MTFARYVNDFIDLLNKVVVPVISALAFAAFVWGVVSYFFLNDGDEKKREEGRSFMLWGLLGLFVLFSTWGFVNLLLSTLGIAPTT